jgi:glucan phosphoethanolaminetransferase (alkaline phosphatase superfamily)
MDPRHHDPLDRRAEAAKFALVRALALDVLAWYCIPAVFLSVCVTRHFLPAEAVAPHLRVLLMPLLALALFRLAVPSRLAASAAAAALLAVMISYYALVLVGLHSWGRVVTWDLISGYAAQASRLADALQISLPLAAGAAVLVCLGLFAAAWAYLGRFDWTAPLRRTVSKPLLAAIASAGGAVVAIELYSFVAGPPTEKFEPVSVTFYPEQAAWDLHGHEIDRLKAARLDAAEDAERAAYAPAASAERKNVVLIVVDALRDDHMGIYGYARDTTPNLSRLEKSGALRKARAMRAACASSFCGLLGISASRFLHQLSARPITVQEALRRHGYRIHLVLSGDHTMFYGLRKAYGEVDSYFDARAKPLRYINDDQVVLERLADFAPWDGAPVMIQFHLMSAHALGSRPSITAKYAPAANYAFHREPGADGGPSERAVNHYDNGVLQADAMIRGILETLEAKGYLKNTVVAITADHGESLGEHGLFQHGNSVREQALRVPFVLLAYGYRPARLIDGHALASQVDVAPTLLAELGMPRPATWKGAALQERLPRDFVYFQEMWDVGLFDLRDPGSTWKYWINMKAGEEHAFNLTLDPGERRDAIGEAPPERKRDWRRRLLREGAVDARARPDWNAR